MVARLPASAVFASPSRPRDCPAAARRRGRGTRGAAEPAGHDAEGLTTEAAAQRLRTLGPNLVAHERQQSLVEELIGRARNPLNFLLLSLAAVSYFLGDKRAAAVIAVMVLLSVSLAFVQEHRSNNAAARLRAMVRTTATVLRRTGAGGQITAKSRSKSSYPEMSSGFRPAT